LNTADAALQNKSLQHLHDGVLHYSVRMSMDAGLPVNSAPAGGLSGSQAALRHGLTDAECVAAVLAGQRQTFEVLVERYQNAIFFIARAATRDAHLAEDIAQEIFILAFNALNTLRDPATFGPWLMQIARRHAALQGKRARQQPGTMPLDAAPSSAIDPASMAAPADAGDRLSTALNWVEQLPEPYRTTVIDKYQRNLSCKEIASAEGVAVGTITSRLTRALLMLRAAAKGS
jgi:RNA polymerase sigma-70 factor (ECF subfamily)